MGKWVEEWNEGKIDVGKQIDRWMDAQKWMDEWMSGKQIRVQIDSVWIGRGINRWMDGKTDEWESGQ